MALIVPILGLLLFGIIEFGYVMSFRGSMSQAASEAARAAATSSRSASAPYDPTSMARAAADSALASFGKSCGAGGMSCSFTIATCGTSDCMTVTLTYDNASNPVMPQVPLLSAAMPGTLKVSSTVKLNAS